MKFYIEDYVNSRQNSFYTVYEIETKLII